jgi:hypothetical protein
MQSVVQLCVIAVMLGVVALSVVIVCALFMQSVIYLLIVGLNIVM